MMRYPSIVAAICGIVLTAWGTPTAAQVYERLQPIVLTPTPVACPSPARLVQPSRVPQPCCDSQLSPSISESISPVVAASELVPLPSGPAWRGYSTEVLKPVLEFTAPAPVVSPAPSVQVLRPDSGPSVPDGYIVGRGLIGQPKLYKPGQPMRNLLRYLSL